MEASATSNPWTARYLKDSFDALAECQLIKHQHDTIGYYVVQRVLDEAELLNIVIFRPFQSKGYGRETLAKLKQNLSESGVGVLFLEVRKSNLAARLLYEKAGFTVINTRRNYYRANDRVSQDKEDALVMQCSIPHQDHVS